MRIPAPAAPVTALQQGAAVPGGTGVHTSTGVNPAPTAVGGTPEFEIERFK
jgi:hypothetical protein